MFAKFMYVDGRQVIKRLISFLLLLLALLVVLNSTPAQSATVSGVTFYKQIEDDNTVLGLRGAGVLRYMVFIKAYAGAFYLPEEVSSKDALADVAKRIEVEYFHPIAGKDFGPATIKGIKDNVDSQTFEALRERIDFHNSLYEDVTPGDRYSLTYIPGRGTELALNGTPKGIIEGADFAAALFSIWLGSQPIDDKFKKALLGQR